MLSKIELHTGFKWLTYAVFKVINGTGGR